MPLTRVYIDGFNLYHGLIAPNRLHWLDLSKFAERLNRNNTVDKVIYCTAMVSGTPRDPDKAHRQEAYIRALGIACPNVDILMGQFTSHNKFKPIANCSSSPTCIIRVSHRSEKGSDVNLAARLLHDAHMNRYERAIVVSGDSDLAEPIRLVKEEIGKTVWVRNPRNMISQELKDVSSHYDRISQSVLQASQLPDVVTDGVKTYHKPAKWSVVRPKLTKSDILVSPCPLNGCGNRISTCRYT